MNKQETIKIISVMKAAFPFWGTKQTEGEIRTAVEVWNEMLKDYDYNLIAATMKALIAIKKDFPPTIGEVIEKASFIKNGGNNELTEVEAWSLVRKALGNGMYGCKEEFEKLPKEVQSVLREPATIRTWSQLDPSEIDTVVASNFMRSFKVVSKNKKEHEALPQEIKNMIEETKIKLLK